MGEPRDSGIGKNFIKFSENKGFFDKNKSWFEPSELEKELYNYQKYENIFDELKAKGTLE